jgi:hypothetical protein
MWGPRFHFPLFLFCFISPSHPPLLRCYVWPLPLCLCPFPLSFFIFRCICLFVNRGFGNPHGHLPTCLFCICPATEPFFASFLGGLYITFISPSPIFGSFSLTHSSTFLPLPLLPPSSPLITLAHHPTHHTVTVPARSTLSRATTRPSLRTPSGSSSRAR